MLADISQESSRKKFIVGCQEVDEQLEWYDKFLNDKIFRIYMSDHGQQNTLINRHHIILSVYHNGIVPRKIKGLFCCS